MIRTARGALHTATGQRKGRLRRAVTALNTLIGHTGRVVAQTRSRLAGVMPESVTRWSACTMSTPARSAKVRHTDPSDGGVDVHAEKVCQDGGGQVGRQGGEGAVAGDSNVNVVAGKPGGQGMVGDWLAGHEAREQPLCRAALFFDDAVVLIHQTSRGYPRGVNNLALQALVAAFAADKAIVDESSTRTAIAEVTAD